MMLRPALALLLMASAAHAADARGTRNAQAVALLDVTQDVCQGRFAIDPEMKDVLFDHFHEYDIAGLASILSGPLNAFYEDYMAEAKEGRDAFCRKAPAESASTGYPVIIAGGN
jgi:hypothetical protein